MDKELVKYAESIINNITPYRVAVFTILISFFLAANVVWEKRNDIVAYLFNTTMKTPVFWNVSQETQKELINLTKSDLIGSVLVTEVDFKKNQRGYKFYHIDDPVLSQRFKPVVENLLPAPFFNENSVNNTQMIELLNGGFICNKTDETIIKEITPEIASIFPYVCRISIPPFIGEFTGILTIGLTKEPTQLEQDTLKIAMTNTALSLYKRDIEIIGHKPLVVK